MGQMRTREGTPAPAPPPLDPFFGSPDYGRYGQPATGPDSLDRAIRKRTRTKMAYYMDFIERPRVKAAAREKSRGLKRN